MRLRRILAIAYRDLRIEFAGKRWWTLPLFSLVMLAPIAFSPPVPVIEPSPDAWVAGDVPEGVLDHPHVHEARTHNRKTVTLTAPPEGHSRPWLVDGSRVPVSVREALDAKDDALTVETFVAEFPELPNRSLLLSLIAASALMGALSQTIPGERSEGTLEPLLAAAVTPMDVALGKWIAWGGYGALAGTLAVLAAVAGGHQSLGPWFLAVPWVPAGSVAAGLWFVRHADDVVGGATVALRMMPAALAATGIFAFWMNQYDPWWGASVPLGGILLAAGGIFHELGQVLWAITITVLLSLVLLYETGRALADPVRFQVGGGLGKALLDSAIALVAWWTTVLGPLTWTKGGSPERTDAITIESSVLGGLFGLAVLVALRFAREQHIPSALGRWRPPARGWTAALLAICALLPLMASDALPPTALTTDGLLTLSADRLAAAARPVGAGVPLLLLAVVTMQELLFRGWMRRDGGIIFQAVVFAGVFFPHDPARGALIALVLGAVVRAGGGSVLPAIAAHVAAAWAVGSLAPAGVLAWAGLILGTLGVLALAWRPDDRP